MYDSYFAAMSPLWSRAFGATILGLATLAPLVFTVSLVAALGDAMG